jgi:beta-lactamase regulating signal transducer with metallopeptidase domain
VNAVFDRIVEASWQASILVGLVLCMQWLMHRRLSPAWRCAMWSLVLVRLLMPALPESRLSLFGLLPRSEPRTLVSSPAVVIHGTTPHPASVSTSVTPLRSPAPARQVPWGSILALTWLAGALLVMLRLSIATVLFARNLRRIQPSTDRSLLDLLDACCRLLHLPRQPRIVETSLVDVPALCGAFNPTILIPAGATAQLSPQQLRFVLLHELVHLKRRDLWIDWVVAVIKAIHWFNPILWLAAGRYRADRELACDARVLALTRQDHRRAYGETILKLVEDVSHPPRLTGAIAMVDGRRSLARRIAAIAQPVLGGWRWSILLAIILIGVAWITLTRPTSPGKLAIDTTDPNVRVYDIRDLIVTIADTSNRRTDEHGWPIPDITPPPSREKLVADLITLIQDTIATDSWIDRGGSTGSIREADGQLIVRQSPENHRQLERLLEQLRETGSVQIVVESRFIAGPSVLDDLRRVTLEKQIISEPLQPMFLNDDQAQALLNSIQGSSTSSTLSAPRVTLFNGQRASVTVHTETAYVADFKRKPDGQFEPVTKTVKSGLNFDCQATVSSDRKYVTMTLRPHLARLKSFDQRPWEGSPQDRKDLVVQVPILDKITASSTVSVPDGGWLVLPPSPDSTFEANPMMLVRPTIIIQKETQQESFPLINGQAPAL